MRFERIVFFDLDGTLHQQDMFGCFLRYLLRHMPQNLLLVLPLTPLIILGLLIQGHNTRWPMSLLLWAITFGHRETRLQALEQRFIRDFKTQLAVFPQVRARLDAYLEQQGTQVWLITGSPQNLVEQLYDDAPFIHRVELIGSQMARRYGGRVLTLRCLGKEKVVQLEQRLGMPLNLFSGYSDSHRDDVLMAFCQHRFRVTKAGTLQPLQ